MGRRRLGPARRLGPLLGANPLGRTELRVRVAQVDQAALYTLQLFDAVNLDYHICSIYINNISYIDDIDYAMALYDITHVHEPCLKLLGEAPPVGRAILQRAQRRLPQRALLRGGRELRVLLRLELLPSEGAGRGASNASDFGAGGRSSGLAPAFEAPLSAWCPWG